VNVFLSVYLILPAALGLRFVEPLTELSTRSREIVFLGAEARPTGKADNLAAVCELIAYII
jgi:hypothetical protein